MIGAILDHFVRRAAPVDRVMAAQQRLAEITIARRDSYEVRRFRERRAASLQGKRRAQYLHMLAENGLNHISQGMSYE